MPRIFLPFLALLILFTVSAVPAAPALSADIQKGLDAYKKGEFSTALSEWGPLAEQGDATAQFGLGALYNFGEGVAQDDKEALRWYGNRLPSRSIKFHIPSIFFVHPVGEQRIFDLMSQRNSAA